MGHLAKEEALLARVAAAAPEVPMEAAEARWAAACALWKEAVQKEGVVYLHLPFSWQVVAQEAVVVELLPRCLQLWRQQLLEPQSPAISAKVSFWTLMAIGAYKQAASRRMAPNQHYQVYSSNGPPPPFLTPA